MAIPTLLKRVDNDFTYHAPPDQETRDKYVYIRDTAKSLAHDLVKMVPEGRELSLALTKLEEAVMWANAGIARRGLGAHTDVRPDP